METQFSDLIDDWSQIHNDLDVMTDTHPNVSLLWKTCLKHKLDLLRDEIRTCKEMIGIAKDDMPDIPCEGILMLSFIPFHLESNDA